MSATTVVADLLVEASLLSYMAKKNPFNQARQKRFERAAAQVRLAAHHVESGTYDELTGQAWLDAARLTVNTNARNHA